MGRSSCFKSKFGTTFESEIWLSLDPCGLLCLTFSAFILASSFLITSQRVIWWNSDIFSMIVFILFYAPFTFLALFSLFKAWITDPGAVPMGAKPLPEINDGLTTAEQGQNTRKRGIRRCGKCDCNFKPPRAHHDSVTGRCIVKFDHFCPWVCNAIGALNHKFFFLFILYTLLTCLVSSLLLLLKFISCGFTNGDDDDNVRRNQQITPTHSSSLTRSMSPVSSYLYPECNEFHSYEVLYLAICTGAFTIFTVAMLLEQIDAIKTNISKVARKKIQQQKQSSRTSHENENGDTEALGRVSNDINEMFGGTTSNPNFAWHWLLPWVPVRFPNKVTHDTIMGYTYDPNLDGNEPYNHNLNHSSTSSLKGLELSKNDGISNDQTSPLYSSDQRIGVMKRSAHNTNTDSMTEISDSATSMDNTEEKISLLN